MPHPAKRQPASGAQMGHDSMFSTKIDPVSRNAIWKEHCLKESSKLKLSSEFSVNPLTLEYIAEKPNRYKPSLHLTQAEIEEARRLLSDVCMSNATDLSPPEKYGVPQTSSQEYGWCSRPLVEPDPFFQFPHKACAITTFATKYQECMHRSPYARRNPVDQHVAKGGVDYAHAGVNTSRIGSPSVASSAQASSTAKSGRNILMKNTNKQPLPTVSDVGNASNQSGAPLVMQAQITPVQSQTQAQITSV